MLGLMMLDHQRFHCHVLGPRAVVHLRRPSHEFATTKRHGLASDGYKSLTTQADDIDLERGRVLIDGRICREAKGGNGHATSMEQDPIFHANHSFSRKRLPVRFWH